MNYIINTTFKKINIISTIKPTITIPGIPGQDGQDGQNGIDGVGVAAGGTAGQILAKVDNTDFNTHWIDAPSGGGGSIDFDGIQNIWGNTILGNQAFNNASASGNYNTAIGFQSQNNNAYGESNISIGFKSMESGSGNENVCVGNETIVNNANNASQNTAIGHNTLRSNRGAQNTAIGARSMYTNFNGSYNVSCGVFSMYNSDGDYNTAIGYRAGISNGVYSNCTYIGYNATTTGSNQIQLGDSSTTTYVFGTVQNRSDARDKTAIKDTQYGLDFILKLKPKDYKFNFRKDYEEDVIEEIEEKIFIGDKEEIIKKYIVKKVIHENDGSKTRNRFHHGFLAQDIEELYKQGYEFGGYQDHSYNGKGEDVKSLGYDEFIAPIVKAIQELNDKHDYELQQLTDEINRLNLEIELIKNKE